MKTLTYTGLLGPEVVSFGEAGQFTKDITRPVDDDALADQLLAKGCFKESPEYQEFMKSREQEEQGPVISDQGTVTEENLSPPLVPVPKSKSKEKEA